jgi:hypothetical protein
MFPVSFSEAVSYEVNQRIKLPQISLTTNVDSTGKVEIVHSQDCHNHCCGF